jgi:DNA-binding transcriptional LysR family regulator
VPEGLPNVRHLAVFEAVLAHGSVSGAARAVHLSQPAVSQAVAALERGVGGKLFERTGRGMSPTAAGRLAAARVGRVLARLRDGIAAACAEPRTAARTARGITAAQLVSIVAVTDAGGFAAAARRRGARRATLHRATRALERLVGNDLFEPTSHGVRPTRAAERLAAAVRLALAEVAQLRAEIAALGGVERGGSVIGAMPLARSAIVPAALLAFARRHPFHALAVLDGPYDTMLAALRAGAADVLVGALRAAVPPDLCQEHLFDDPLAVVARRAHPLAAPRARAPSPADLARYPWIAPRAGSPLRRQFDTLLACAAGVPPAAPIECNSLVAARALLLASDRLMLLSAHQVHHELASGQLVLLPHPAGPVTRPIGLTLRSDWQPTPAQSHLLDAIRAEARRVAPRVRRAAILEGRSG